MITCIISYSQNVWIHEENFIFLACPYVEWRIQKRQTFFMNWSKRVLRLKLYQNSPLQTLTSCVQVWSKSDLSSRMLSTSAYACVWPLLKFKCMCVCLGVLLCRAWNCLSCLNCNILAKTHVFWKCWAFIWINETWIILQELCVLIVLLLNGDPVYFTLVNICLFGFSAHCGATLDKFSSQIQH